MKISESLGLFCQTWRRSAPYLLLGVGLCVLPQQGLCQPTTEDVETVDVPWLAAGENRFKELVQQAVVSKGVGAKRFLFGKEVMPLSVQEVVKLVKERNLLLAMQPHQVKLAQQEVLAAEASFSPVLNLSLQYSRSSNYARTDMIERLRPSENAETDYYGIFDKVTDEDLGTMYLSYFYKTENKTLFGDDSNITEAQMSTFESEQEVEKKEVTQSDIDAEKTWYDLGAVAYDPCITIDGESVDTITIDGQSVNAACSSDLVSSVEEESASSDSNSWYQSWSGRVRLSDLLFWGGSVNATLNTSMIPYEVSQSASLKAMGYPLEKAWDLGDEQWSSDLSIGFSSPLPYSKNFGSDGFGATVQVKKRTLDYEKSRWVQAGQVNQIVKQALGSYWSLVRSVLNILSTLEHREVLAQRLSQVERLFKLERVTEYDLLQAQADLEDARNLEEIAWNSWVSRNNELAEILDLPVEQIALPQNYREALTSNRVPDDQAVLDAAMKNRAEIRMAQLDVDKTELEERYRSHQLLPDLDFNASYSAMGKGSSSVFGYTNFSDSISALSSPDERSYFVGLQFNYPWDNQAAKAQRSKAHFSYAQSLDASRAVEIQVGNDVATALASSHGSRIRTRLAKAELKLSEDALRRAETMRKLERTTEFELLQRHQDLFDARIKLIQAMIDQRQAWVALQAAEGNLAAGYVNHDAEMEASP